MTTVNDLHQLLADDTKADRAVIKAIVAFIAERSQPDEDPSKAHVTPLTSEPDMSATA